MAKQDTPTRWDRKMQQRLARGEAAALGELYDRFASLVHGLAHRVLGDEQAADRITREVFAHVWQHPDTYDPKQGPLRSCLATLTHRLAVQRLRQTETAALAQGDATQTTETTSTTASTGSLEELERRVRRASVAARADYIVTSMPAPLRAALELAYFQRRDYRQTAADLGVTEAEARRRLRLGLQLLSTAHDTGTPGAPPEYGGAV
ncbi:MAG: sigma-70 family RNA polymerase sigma factor [Streptomyces turgidiscabies]|nr:sigma-70 family RNA polymerase sigma factor [Streptomyces turgidiscabies]